MTALKLEQFGGMLPAWDDHLLPPGQAASSINGYLFGGSLQGWRKPKLLRNLTNSAAKFAFRIPTVTKNKASAVLVFKSNVNAGDTVTLGDETYTFTATVTNAYDVLLGATATDSAKHLLAAFTIDNGAATNEGTWYGKATTANPAIDTNGNLQDVWNSDPYLKVIAPDYGAAYNSTPVSENTGGARVVWLSDLNFSLTTTTFQNGTNPSFDSSITGAATWVEFLDPDTSVMRSPVVDDQFDRYYFSSPSQAPEYNTADRIRNGQPAWLLGVPPPGCAPGVEVTGGGDTATLGAATVSGVRPGTFTVPANYIYLIKVTPTGSLQLNDVAFMPQTTGSSATDAAVEFAAVLYSDNNGSPGTLLNTGAIETGITPGSTSSSAFVNPTGLLANSSYWFGILTNTALPITLADSGATGYIFSNTFTNGPAAVAPTGSAGQATIQLWGDMSTQDILEARAYLYTWVTEYDEEGPPSPPTLINGWSNGTWTITLWTPPPDDMGVTRNIKSLNLYRTVTATGGSTTYYFIANIPVGTLTYVDAVTDDVVVLNNQMESTNWFPPPEGLQSIISMPNGMAVGFKNNEIWFCEPYRPHAWPPGYVITTEFPIVGIGVSGQAVCAATGGHPYVAQGVAPASVTLSKIPLPEPCISRASVLGTPEGVYYMSPNGLILINTGTNSGTNTTEMWITRERWSALTPQVSPRAIRLASSYFCFAPTAGFTIELNQDNQSFSIWPQPGGHRLGFNQLLPPSSYNVDNILVDPWTGVGLLIQNGQIYYYDFADQAPDISTYKWRSRIYQQTSKKNFEALKVFFSVPPGIPAQSATRNTAAYTDPSWAQLAPGQYGIVRVYGDGKLVTVREIRTSGELLRIASGFKVEEWQWEFEGIVNISNVQIATSAKELAQV